MVGLAVTIATIPGLTYVHGGLTPSTITTQKDGVSLATGRTRPRSLCHTESRPKPRTASPRGHCRPRLAGACGVRVMFASWQRRTVTHQIVGGGKRKMTMDMRKGGQQAAITKVFART